ncbi:uncharacterized protein LOC116245600 [Nymphaea colorata]|uniref:uncharacterized protein LOC116245600 n=1 Tax=Nymphaea colorata TaxID=210225 RepID=UPI00214F3EC9|nr:uncharacterized protein LOC116245600 [Nymphaea colorata]
MGHMLFIDQPLNVGFSYSGNRTGTQQVSSSNEGALHLVNFLYNFYREWPKLAASPLYITGESFAGHYIPAFAREILLNETFKAATKVNLKGVAIGDGWVDPINQFNYYDSLLYSAGIISNKFREDDYVINTAGVLNYLNSVNWNYISNWKRARKDVWRINNQIRGWAKTYGNLWFVLVNRAGHLVPTDQPESAFNMFGHFVRDDRNWNQ